MKENPKKRDKILISFQRIFFGCFAMSVVFSHQLKGQIIDTVPQNISVSYQTIPSFTRNIDRINLITHYHFKEAWDIYYTNTSIRKYCDSKFQSIAGFTIGELYDSLNADMIRVSDAFLTEESKHTINENNKRDVIYSLCTAKLYTSKSEVEINDNIRSISKDLIALGYNDFERDFMPFLARMLAEHREIFYEGARIITFDKAAHGVVTGMDIIDAHKNPDVIVTAGACRDVSEFALRMMRQSFGVYYNEAQQKNYNPDKYIFLQAWTTPLSQHVTVLMVDPENPRNGYDLDWGRTYERKNQEGLETPNNFGTDIRLWRFDAGKNHTIPVMLIKTDKGQLLDKNILNDEELKSFNSAFYKTYYSDVKFEKSVNEHIYWNVSAGKLNGNLYYMLGSIMHKSRKLHIGKYINYYGKTALQPHYYENSEVQSKLIPWKTWSSSQNLSLLTRYIAKFETNDWILNKNFSFQIVSQSQIYLLLNTSKFYNDYPDDQHKMYKSGDGNIYTTYGGKFSYASNSQKIKMDILCQRRNYLSPKEVRLLGPNPFVLLENARVVCSANDLISAISMKLNSTEIKLNTVYEYDILKTQIIQNEFSLIKETAAKNNYVLTFGFNKQLTGLNYYWYPQNKIWFQAGSKISKINSQINFSFCLVQGCALQSGIGLQKYF